MENLKNLSSSDKMTNEISALSLVESFLDEYYLFRRNVLSGKTEYLALSKNEDEDGEPVEEEPENGGEEEESSDSTWKVLTPEAFNSIVRHAKRLGVGGKKSPDRILRSSYVLKRFRSLTLSGNISRTCRNGMVRTMWLNSLAEFRD